MKNKTSLVLIEILVMVLVFSLAAAMCLRAFGLSDKTSRENERLSRAMFLVQNAAEAVKGAKGDLTLISEKLSAAEKDGAWCVNYDENWEVVRSGEGPWTYRIEIRLRDSDTLGLGKAQVCAVASGEAEPIFTVSVAWQEVG